MSLPRLADLLKLAPLAFRLLIISLIVIIGLVLFRRLAVPNIVDDDAYGG